VVQPVATSSTQPPYHPNDPTLEAPQRNTLPQTPLRDKTPPRQQEEITYPVDADLYEEPPQPPPQPSPQKNKKRKKGKGKTHLLSRKKTHTTPLNRSYSFYHTSVRNT